MTGATAAPDRVAPVADETVTSPRTFLWRALRTRRADLWAAGVLYSTHQIGESLVPVIVGATVSRALARHHDGGSPWSLVLWLGLLAADFAFLSMSYRFGARASMRAKQGVAHEVRMWLTDRVVAPAGGIDHPPGDLLSRASSDAGRVGAFAGILAMLAAAATVLVTSIVLLLRFSVLLCAVIVLGTVLLLVVQHAVADRLRRRSITEQYEQARATVLAEDFVRGLRVIKGIGAERNAAATYRTASRQAVRAALDAATAEATLTMVGSLLTGCYLALIAAAGGWLALRGDLGLGELVAALGLARFLIGPMEGVSQASGAYARALASAGRIRDVLAAAPAVISDAGDGGGAGVGSEDVRGKIVLDDVTLGSTPVSLRVEAGSMTGVVVTDAVAAAHLLLLLGREREVEGGGLLIDGRPIGDLPLDALRRAVLVAYHDSPLLPGTVGENLALLAGDHGDPEAVAAAAGAAMADEVVAAIPAGADTDVGERGEALSGGQRQRVALARALAAQPPVLVLHDPTTAVDAATEDRVAAGVRELRARRTTVVVTTSPAWLSRCEKVVFVHDGSTLVGEHAQLLATTDAYRQAVTR